MNRHYLSVVNLIFRASGAWEFDDQGKTDLPVLTSTLVNGQEDYELPVSTTTNAYTLQGGVSGGGILKIHRVEILDENSIWHRLKQLDQKQINGAYDEFLKTDGRPSHYDVKGGSIFLKPAPATGYVTMASGLKIYILREPYVFTATDTTREPGFAELFHERLIIGPAYDWFMSKDQSKAPAFKARMDDMDRDIVAFYGDRNKDYTPRLVPRRVCVI